MYRVNRGILSCAGSGLKNRVSRMSPAAWFQPGVGVTGTLTASNWADQSGNGRDLAQGTAGNQPIYLPYSGTAYGYLPAVASNFFSTPDNAAFPTGDCETVARINMSSMVGGIQSVIGQGTAGASLAARLVISSATPIFQYTPDGSTNRTATSSAAVSFSAGDTFWLKATYVSATGKVNFYTSTTDTNEPLDASWTLLGTEQTITSGAIFGSSATVCVGAQTDGTNQLGAKVYRAQIKSTIGGAAVIDFSPSTFAETSTNGATAVASTGETWTLNSTGAKPAQIVKSAMLLFDGTNSWLKTAAFTLNQPETIYIVVKQITHVENRVFFSGDSSSVVIQQSAGSPNVRGYAGNFGTAITSLALDSVGIMTLVVNGASSLLQHNNNTAVTNNLGANNSSGFTLGGEYTGTSDTTSNIQVKELIAFSAAHSAAERSVVRNYLAARHGIAL